MYIHINIYVCINKKHKVYIYYLTPFAIDRTTHKQAQLVEPLRNCRSAETRHRSEHTHTYVHIC